MRHSKHLMKQASRLRCWDKFEAEKGRDHLSKNFVLRLLSCFIHQLTSKKFYTFSMIYVNTLQGWRTSDPSHSQSSCSR